MTVVSHSKNNVNILGNLNATQTIVFGNGFGTDQTAFHQVIPAFIDDYEILMYDNIGGGNTDTSSFDPVRYNSILAYSIDLISILDEHDLKDVIFIGHSVSGMIGLLASIKRPELFDRIILLAASARYLNDADNDYIGGFDQQSLDDLYAMMKNSYHAWASGFASMVMSNPDNPALAAKFAGTLEALRPDIALMVAKVIFQSDYRRELEKVTRPVLVVQSQDDIAVPMAAAEFLHENIKGSEYEIIDARGHLPHVSAPDAVIKAIRSFI
jgi:sigma-B regulation protein RsbQ